MLNSQPLGLYSPSQLTQDAKRHGVEVRRVDVMASDWDCTLEGLPHTPAVRLGLRQVIGLKAETGNGILKTRTEQPFESAENLARRAEVEQHEMTLLAAADALMSLAGHRRQQAWEAAGQRSAPRLLKHAPVDEEELELPEAPEGAECASKVEHTQPISMIQWTSSGFEVCGAARPACRSRRTYSRSRPQAAVHQRQLPAGAAIAQPA